MTLKPSVCIDAVLDGWGLQESLDAVSRLGYPAFEFWAWWEKDLQQLQELKEARGLEVAACCTKFISLIEPHERAAYISGLRESIDVAQKLGCKTLISQVGDALPGIERDIQRKNLVTGLREAAEVLDGSGVTLAIEPLNDLIDHPGYFLVESGEAFRVVEEVDSPLVKLTFDIYHQQISEGHLISTMLANLDKIAHLHAAGNPGRHELDVGEIHYPGIIEAIQAAGFDGYLGLEYWPINDPLDGLQAARRLF